MSGNYSAGLKHPDADCTNCPLNKGKYVPNHLPVSASIAFVGEAPGYKEASAGHPFVGPSGKLLHRAAADAGVTVDEQAQLTIIGCQTPKNRPPTTTEVQHCAGRLKGDLARLTHLDTVVALGNTATRYFMGKEVKITQARVGPPKEWEDKRFIPTLNPAACLRTGDFYPYFASDLKKVTQAPSKWEEPEWALLDTRFKAYAWLQGLLTEPSQPVVVDIEVGIEKDSDFSHPERYQILCVGLVIGGSVVVLGEEACTPETLQLLGQVLLHHQAICHNGKFDLTLWPEVPLFFDTMLASYVLDERPGTNSLEYNAVEILGSPNWKAEIDRYLGEGKNYAVIPRDILYQYNAFDIWNTWLLFWHFSKVMTPEERKLHDDLCRLSAVLMHAEMKGSKLDFEYLQQLDLEMVTELDGLEKLTSEWVANPRSPKQVKEAFAQLGHDLTTTREMVLVDLARKANEETLQFIGILLKYRERQKLHSTYVKGLLKREHEGRINPSFLIHGTTTGRLSSRNPNIQNQPRGPIIRSAFIPDPGFVYVQADYKTAELRVLGVEANDAYLVEVLSDPNRDIHGEVATQFYGEGWTKDQRVRAKAVVFGVSYGREAESIALEFGITKLEAQGAIDAFFALIPDVVAYREDLVHRVFRQGWDPVNHFGRKRRFHLITKDNRYDVEKQLYAFIPQSTANDICFRAATRLWEMHHLDIRILVHDSVLVQARPDESREVGELMARVMQETAEELYSDKIPFYVDYEVGDNWGALV